MDNCLPTLSWIILSVRTETNFGSETHKITSPEELLTIFKAAGLWKNVKEIEYLYNTRYNNIDLKTAKLRSIERLICRVYRKHYFGLWLPNLCLMPATVVSEKKVLFIVYLSKRRRRERDDKQILYPSATKRTELEYWKILPYIWSLGKSLHCIYGKLLSVFLSIKIIWIAVTVGYTLVLEYKNIKNYLAPSSGFCSYYYSSTLASDNFS